MQMGINISPEELQRMMTPGTQPNGLTIVTPLSRAKNLRRLFLNVHNARARNGSLAIRWLIVIDSGKITIDEIEKERWIREAGDWIGVTYFYDKNSRVGHGQRNFALDMLKGYSTFVYFLDDDTLLHPDFISVIEMAIRDHPDKSAFVFHQQRRDNWPRLLAKPENMKVGSIDTGQFVLHTSLIDRSRFRAEKYDADGYFVEEIYGKDPGAFHFIDRPLSIYNALR